MAYDKKEYNREYSKRTNNAAQNKYYTEKTRNISLRLRLEEDSDVIKKLDSMPNKVDYMRELIREDIRREENT